MEIKPFSKSTLEEQVALLAEFDKLPERVRLYVWDGIKSLYPDLGYGLLRFAWCAATAAVTVSKCESPIEQLMAFALAVHLPPNINRGICATYHPQHPIEAGGKKYRADFYISYTPNSSDPSVLWRGIVVECDGHDFHEKTKQQAAKDKQRERAIQTAGYPILRFTGSEIYKDPTACVQEIADFINAASEK